MIAASLILTWLASPDPVSHYNIYLWDRLIGQTEETMYIDNRTLWGCYTVTAVGPSGLESEHSNLDCHGHGYVCPWTL